MQKPELTFQLPLKSTISLTLASLAGLVASLGLLKTEIEHLNNPTGSLNCDLSLLVGCSSSISSPEAHLLLGLPNTALGIGFFSILLFVAVASILGTKLPRPLWNLLAVATAGSLGVIVFFLYASIFKFQALCPYCLVIWSATFIATGILLPFATAICGRETIRRIGQPLHANAWAVVVGLFLITAITVLLGMSEKIGMML